MTARRWRPAAALTWAACACAICVCAICTWAICNSAAAADGPPAPASVPTARIVRAEFGLFSPPASGRPAFQSSAVVPRSVDQSYGWVIVLAGPPPSTPVRVREVLTLPGAPSTWGDPEPQIKRKVSADGRTATTELQLVPERGVIAQAWAVAPGDPAGAYMLRVQIDGGPEQVFRFEVK